MEALIWNLIYCNYKIWSYKNSDYDHTQCYQRLRYLAKTIKTVPSIPITGMQACLYLIKIIIIADMTTTLFCVNYFQLVCLV